MRSLTLLGLAAAACSSPPEAVDPEPRVRIIGSETGTASLLPALAAEHSRTLGTLEFDIAGGGSGQGIRSLLEGAADLAVASRPHMPSEEEFAQRNGYSLDADGSQHVVGVDVAAVSVHPSNSVGSLTYDQVIGIFCTGTIDDWSFVGQEPRPIRAMSRDASSGTRALFEDFFCGPRGIHDSVEIADIDDIRTALADDSGAITFVSMTEGYGRVLGLKPDPRSPAMLPSQANIIRGAYPLYHDVMLYSAGPPTGATADFLVWIASPAGQDVVDDQRFVPLFLRPERLDEPRPLRETLHFDPGTAELTLRSRARVQLLVDELRERAGEYQHIVLEGFADSREGEAVTLSEQRAQAVQALVEAELPGLYFEIIGRGSTRPIAPNETPYGRERNRRVQVYIGEEEEGYGVIEEVGADGDTQGG